MKIVPTRRLPFGIGTPSEKIVPQGLLRRKLSRRDSFGEKSKIMDCCQSAACRTPKIQQNPYNIPFFKAFARREHCSGGVEFGGGYDGRRCRIRQNPTKIPHFEVFARRDPSTFILRRQGRKSPCLIIAAPKPVAAEALWVHDVGTRGPYGQCKAGRYGSGIFIAPEYTPAAAACRSPGALGARRTSPPHCVFPPLR